MFLSIDCHMLQPKVYRTHLIVEIGPTTPRSGRLLISHPLDAVAFALITDRRRDTGTIPPGHLVGIAGYRHMALRPERDRKRIMATADRDIGAVRQLQMVTAATEDERVAPAIHRMTDVVLRDHDLIGCAADRANDGRNHQDRQTGLPSFKFEPAPRFRHTHSPPPSIKDGRYMDWMPRLAKPHSVSRQHRD
jgi:hypothetical protein